MKGDLNFDGKISREDLDVLKRIIASAESLADKADVNGDGVVNVKDIAVLKKILKKIEEI